MAEESRNAMPEENNADTTKDESSPNRRRMLQFIGTGAFGMGGLGSLARASPSSGKGVRSYSIDELTNAERQQTIGFARHTSKFRQLREYLKKEYNIKVDNSSVSAYDLTITRDDMNKKYQMVIFPLEHEAEGQIVIGLQDGEFVDSKSSIVDIDEEKETAHVTEINVENRQVKSQTIQQDLSTGAVNNGEVSAQISQCDACIELVNFICTERCGLGAAAICFVVGLAGAVPGVGCTVLAAYLCYRIDPEDCRRSSSRALCNFYGYC